MSAATNSETLTYGDTFTIPSAPGTVWELRDVRYLEKAGYPGEFRAGAFPVERDGRPIERRDAVKIGRAERTGVYLELGRGVRAYDFDTDTSTIDPDALNVRAFGDLTDAQRAAVTADLAALSFDLPALSADDIRARMLAQAEYTGRRAAREAQGNLPDRYSRPDAQYGRPVIAAAMNAEARTVYIATAVAAFAGQLADDLARYVGEAQR